MNAVLGNSSPLTVAEVENSSNGSPRSSWPNNSECVSARFAQRRPGRVPSSVKTRAWPELADSFSWKSGLNRQYRCAAERRTD